MHAIVAYAPKRDSRRSLDMNDTTYKIGRILTWLCGMSSCLLLFLWVAMAISCRLGLGHWPEPMIENYSGRAYEVLDSAFFLWGYFTFFLAGPTLLLGLIIDFSARPNRFRAILYGSGWMCLLSVIAFDPTSFSEWWFD